MSFTIANIPLPKTKRVPPPGRPSKYKEALEALVADSGACFSEPVANEDEAEKAKQRFSSAVSNFKESSNQPLAHFTIREFNHPETQALHVGVWRLTDRKQEDVDRTRAARAASAAKKAQEVAAKAADSAASGADTGATSTDASTDATATTDTGDAGFDVTQA